jgi:phosphoribosylformylglycinamidine synthase I
LRVAVIRFPGTNCDLDTVYVLRNLLGLPTDLVWHMTFKGDEYDAAILPGGFSYGDYLRAGAIAAHSPAIREVEEMANGGKPILGICNGFQILIEAGLLPGALLPNDSLTFVCRWVTLRCETDRSAFTHLIPVGDLLHLPVAHKEGRYFNEERALKEMAADGQIVFRYTSLEGAVTLENNPNGSVDNIAGICNREGNVLGLMPHPERASEKILSPFGDDDGLMVFESMVNFLRKGGRVC